MKKILAAVCLLASFSATAEWVLVSENEYGTGLFVDPNIKKNANLRMPIYACFGISKTSSKLTAKAICLTAVFGNTTAKKAANAICRWPLTLAPWPRVKSRKKLINPVTGCPLAATLAAKPCTNTFAVCKD